MSRKPLSPTFLDNATSKGKVQVDFFDALCPGLAICVARTGRKTWTFTYSPPGSRKRTKISIGTYPGLSMVDARLAAEKARGLVGAGTDPRNVAARPADKTVAELVEDIIKRKLRPKGKPPLRTADEIERRYRKEVIPVVGMIPVKEFEVSHWNKVLEPIEDRECFILANRVFGDMKQLLRFGVRVGEIKFNPLSELEPPFEETSKTRNLSLEEIQHFWHWCPQALIRSPKVQLILKLCLTTGKRNNEVCGAKRSEIDWGKRLWTIPKERVKGREGKVVDEIVPLSDLAFALLQEAARKSNSEYLFPNEGGDGPYVPEVVGKIVRTALQPAKDLPLGRFGMVPWTCHDLRRTVGTQLLNKANGLGVTKEQKYLVLNHASDMKQNVSDRVYDMNDYIDEKREALEKWGNFLAKLVGVELQQQEAA